MMNEELKKQEDIKTIIDLLRKKTPKKVSGILIFIFYYLS